MENLNKFLLALFLLTSCTVTWIPDGQYDSYHYEDHPHSTEVYYNDTDIYWGYYSGFYYYYGIPHFYPWWYYYQFLPPYHYHTHTHVHVHCDKGYFVYKHRGNKINNKENKEFNASIKAELRNRKTNVFPRDWKSHNSTKNTKQDNWWNKVNMNKTDYNRNFNHGNSYKINNKHNNTININKNNTINKGNNGPTRSNKTNTTRKPKK